jgi:hypothetical protein
MKAPLNIVAWPVNIVRGQTGAVEGPLGPTGPAGELLLAGATGPTGSMGRFYTGPAGITVSGPTGPGGMTGPAITGLSRYVDGPTGVKGPGLPYAIWTGATGNPTGPHGPDQYNSFQGLQIKITPVKTGYLLCYFTGTFSNNVNLAGMDIYVQRVGYEPPPFGVHFYGGPTCVQKSFRNLPANMRTEFVLEYLDDFGSSGRGPEDLVDRDWWLDLVLVVVPSGSFVRLYDLEWVVLEI